MWSSLSPRELMMRVNAVVSRTHAVPRQDRDVFEREGLKIDFTGRIVYIDGERISLSPKEYELLFYLVRNRNIALSAKS